MSLVLLIPSCKKADNPKIFFKQNQAIVSSTAINLNTATAPELEKLPHVGAETARRIITFREQHGSFRRAENIILIDGMSDKKFREIRYLVKVE